MEPQKFLATDEGLEFAEGVARQLGMEFDRDATRIEADEMHDLYFNAIVRVTGLPVSLVAFHAAALRKVNAYVPFSETEQGEVFFDEQLDAWLLAMSQLITIMACKPIEVNEVGALVFCVRDKSGRRYRAASSRIDTDTAQGLHLPPSGLHACGCSASEGDDRIRDLPRNRPHRSRPSQSLGGTESAY
jgi:hypothetical protein